jgi:adenylate cyclase
MTVFIGINLSGPSADVFKTPMDNRHPGVDIQATVYDNISNNHFIKDLNIFIQFLSVLLLSLFTFILILKYNFLRSLLSIIFIDILYFIICGVLAYNGSLLSFINPISIQLITLIFGYSFKFLTENRNKEKIKQAMGKYISQDVMKNVVKNIDELGLGGKRAIVTVLFSDIRGFTSLSEKMTAEEVSKILNEYFSQMEPIITKYNGVINKFIGDAVMAIFGEPIQDINHPKNAVKCAYEMLKKVEYLREKWLSEGKPKIEIGVGINTGEAFIGNIGTETRMEYTVIGDTVNLASRIEGYNKVYKTNLLVSSSTYNYISDIADVIKIKEVQIRGKSKKMDIYEVLRIEGLKK